MGDSIQDKTPLQTLPEQNLFGLENQDYKNARVIVLPVPYDATVSYKSGTREGPQAIINASRNLELYSYEVGADPSKIGIYTLQSMAPNLSSPENMIAAIKKEIGIILDDNKIPLILGGEHTITLGALQALKEKNQDISILHFDAHSDSREELFGSRYMHATVITRAKEMYPDIFQIGLRSIDAATATRINREKMLFADEIEPIDVHDTVSRILDSTKDKVYLTFDFDVLDPGEMPSVGTPEPGGMHFNQVSQILKGIGDKKELVGLDFVELCPIPYLHAPDYAAAKLIYLTLGYFLSKGD